MASVTTPIGVLALGAGGALIWSAFTGQNPLAELRAALSTGKLPEGGGPTPVTPAVVAASVERYGGTGSPAQTDARVPIGQGSHRLAPAAASAFRAAEQAFGRSIPITDSSRSSTQQAANRARDPDRFGPAEGNAHVEGRAVDVNLGAVGAYPKGEPSQWMNDPAYARLARAMMSAGWCNYQLKNGTANGRTREPWHWAIGRCN